MADIEDRTGALFSALFTAYDDDLFRQSVDMFVRRFSANDVDIASLVAGKDCLDAGCGGGRYTVALAALGASRAVGVDVAAGALADAAQRAHAIGITAEFRETTVLDLPFADCSFDFVVSNGVLHHTADPITGLRECARVLRPGGRLYLMLYATGGIRWPLVQQLRPLATAIGMMGLTAEGMPANRRRTYLDDLFVPLIDFYTPERLYGELRDTGFVDVHRFDRGRLDHEESLDAYLADLAGFAALFGGRSEHHKTGRALCDAAIGAVRSALKEAGGGADTRTVTDRVIGVGHHRVLAVRS